MNEDSLGAEAQGLGGGHRRADAVGSSRVGGRGDYPSPAGASSHDDRLARDPRVQEFLHRGEEGIEIDMD